MKNWTARGMSKTWASSRWTLTFVCVVTAMASGVQIASAQDPAATTITVSPVPVLHVVQPGVVPANTTIAALQLNQAQPMLDVPPAASAGLIILPTFDTSITNDPNAAAIEATINAAIATVESQFSDPIIVNITFGEGGGLGESISYYGTVSYATFISVLKNDAKTGDDATAAGLLAGVAANPVNGNLMINVKTANLRALGFAVNPPAGQPDGFINVNTTITSPGSPGSTGTYNLLPVVLHEIDEVLGLGSSLPAIFNNTIFPEDLFRYSATNTRTFTTADSRTSGVFAYFSIDAATFLAEFDNQNDGGDFGDWQSNPRRTGVGPKVQDAFATPGASPAMSVELTALDVVGYDRVTSTDVGTVGVPGTVSQSGGTWTVSGSGADIWDTSDSFQFVHVGSSVTSAIEARVMDLQDTNPFAKAGVMLRASTAADSATIILDVRPNGALEFMVRYQDGAVMNFITGGPAASLTFPVSLRLNWVNGRVSPWFSQDGVHWQRVAADDSFIAMTSTPEAGLAVTSHDQNQLTTAHFTNVSFAAFPPPGWNSVDVGDVGQIGGAAETNGVWTVTGAGGDIWGIADAFHFVYRGALDTVDRLKVRIDDMQNTQAFAKAGLIVRSSLRPDASTVIVDVTPSGNVEVMARTMTGGEMQYIGGTTVTFPVWLLLTNTSGAGFPPSFAVSVSTDGINWDQPINASPALEPAPLYYAGLAVTSHDTSRTNVVHADALSFGAIPIEIGGMGVAGNGSIDQTQPNLPITIEAAGADIWGTQDSFDFIPVSAGDMTAYRVVRLNAANPLAKAGVMYRDGLLPNAVNVILDAKPDGSVEFMARRCAGCNTEYLGGAQVSFPMFLILTRSGSTYMASVSTADLAHRTAVGSVDLSMTDSCPGLAVTSHDPTVLAVAVFDTPP